MPKNSWHSINKTPDNSDNRNIADDIGSKEDAGDGHPGYTIAGLQWRGYQHIHAPAKIYPDLADPVVLSSSATAVWTLGPKTEIIPANAVIVPFDIHYINVSEISATDDYVIVLYSGLGGAEIEIGRVAFTRSSIFSQEGNRPIQIAPQHANTRISAALACGDGDGATCRVKVYFHEYLTTGMAG